MCAKSKYNLTHPHHWATRRRPIVMSPWFRLMSLILYANAYIPEACGKAIKAHRAASKIKFLSTVMHLVARKWCKWGCVYIYCGELGDVFTSEIRGLRCIYMRREQSDHVHTTTTTTTKSHRHKHIWRITNVCGLTNHHRSNMRMERISMGFFSGYKLLQRSRAILCPPLSTKLLTNDYLRLSTMLFKSLY